MLTSICETVAKLNAHFPNLADCLVFVKPDVLNSHVLKIGLNKSCSPLTIVCRKKIITLVQLILWSCWFIAPHAGGQESIFVGYGNPARWSDLVNWKPARLPDENSKVILSEDYGCVVTIDRDAVAKILEIGNDDEVILKSGRSLLVLEAFQNDGVCRLESNSDNGNQLTEVRISNDVTFEGDGVMRLSVFFDNRVVGVSDSSRLINSSEHWIFGSGQIGANTLALINDGVIKADQSVPLRIDPVDSVDAGVVNNHLLVATNGAELQLAAGCFDNRNGQLIAENKSTITLLKDAAISGGELKTEGSGRILVPSGSCPRLDSITNNGLIFNPARKTASERRPMSY